MLRPYAKIELFRRNCMATLLLFIGTILSAQAQGRLQTLQHCNTVANLPLVQQIDQAEVRMNQQLQAASQAVERIQGPASPERNAACNAAQSLVEALDASAPQLISLIDRAISGTQRLRETACTNELREDKQTIQSETSRLQQARLVRCLSR
jgi:hypothetical protein